MSGAGVCKGGSRLVFSCSGAADVGLLADQVGRKLNREGKGRMFCLAGVGGKVGPIVETTRKADRVLAIDGCPLNCAKECLSQAGVTDMVHVQLADLGCRKGESPTSESKVAEISAHCEKLLAAE